MQPSVWAISVAALIFFIMVTRRFAFVIDPGLNHLYESQARSLLHGHVDVPLSAIGGEGFLIDGKYYAYFGPTPAIARLPIMLFVSSGEPFLAPWYMLAVFVLAGIAISGIAARIGLDGWVAAAFTFVGLVGSALVTLSERTLAYEEATLWGASLLLLTIWAALHLLEAPSRRWALVAVSAATFGILARPTTGMAAVAVVFAVAVLRRTWWLLLGCLAAVGAYAFFSLWKFGALYPPFTHHRTCARQPECLVLAQNGSMQPKYFPTNFVQYFRPDLLRFEDHFPWIGAPRYQDAPIRLIGVSAYLGTDRMSSVTATMPALLALSVVGFATTFWQRRWLILASCVGPLLTCMFFGATKRYLADFVPTLILAGACGLRYMLASRWRRVSSIVIVVLAGWSIIVCVALAFQKSYG